MIDGFVETEEEARQLLGQMLRTETPIKKSKLYPNHFFWNTTGRETRPDFPTIYFHKDLIDTILYPKDGIVRGL